MPLSLPILYIVSACACAFAVGLGLLAGVLLAWRNTIQQFSNNPSELQARILPEIGAIVEQIENRLATQDRHRLSDMDQLRQSVAHMRADVEWLVGERMIEQAIEMCRDGLSTDRISADLGLQPDAVKAIRLLRVH